ncbi:MAG: UDP-N-acetylglucosamine 2-epimerase (non-hydrolyzing) [Chloroflexi bacterium]|nr:MAG: UDP-N-acetylglucosamine 2-epimerase (non-hydrolyzing) [Chloroflexota bacterium]
MRQKFKTIHNPDRSKICVVVGTRPGIIKMSPIIRELERREMNFFVIHAGQHYSYKLDRKIFEDIGLREPKYKLETVKNYNLHGAQTAEMLKGIEEILINERPGVVLVCGDANFNLAGALAARKLGLKVGHVEAGLRSDDWRMPEEHNRVMIDHISDYLFAPTEEAKQNAIRDNVKGEIFVVGNTIVDAVYQNIEIAKRKSKILDQLGVQRKNYILLTLHREENVDFLDIIKSIILGLKLIAKKYQVPIIYPIHPRTKKNLYIFNLHKEISDVKGLQLIDPLGYLDFLRLLADAKLVLTDSGGVQEESCILKVPCITLRENTERPETVKVGSNKVVGTRAKSIIEGVDEMINKPREWNNPFGDGTAARRIVDIILKRI